MKVSVYLKKSDSSTSNICFRVREKNVDIKVVSPLVVQDKYWDSDTLSYKRTTAVPAVEQKLLPEQIAAIIEKVEKTFSDKANSAWLKQTIEDVLHPARAFERNHPNLICRIHEYLEKFDGADRTKEHIIRFERKMSRYHDYQREILGSTDFMLFVETVTLEQMNDFRDYVVNEHLLQQEHPGFYASRLLVKRKPKPLSGTTVINIMNLFCTFLHWCKKMKYSDNEVYTIEMLMNQAGVTIHDRKVVDAALEYEKITNGPAAAIELHDGRIIKGKTSKLLGATAAMLLNALKDLAGIEHSCHVISPEAIEPIQTLKTKYLGNKNPRLHTDEVLIALSVSAASNPLAKKALEQLPNLAGCQAHTSVMVSSVDIKQLKRLSIQATYEAKYEKRD